MSKRAFRRHSHAESTPAEMPSYPTFDRGRRGFLRVLGGVIAGGAVGLLLPACGHRSTPGDDPHPLLGGGPDGGVAPMPPDAKTIHDILPSPSDAGGVPDSKPALLDSKPALPDNKPAQPDDKPAQLDFGWGVVDAGGAPFPPDAKTVHDAGQTVHDAGQTAYDAGVD